MHEGGRAVLRTIAVVATVVSAGTLGYIIVERGEESHFNPAPDTRIEAGDVLVALGPTQDLERVEKALG
jgi:Trk K+ transport system NAD-binding subunit